jgi:hypothetical protein
MSVLDLFHAEPTPLPTVHALREWAITSYFQDHELDTAARMFHVRGEDKHAYDAAIEYLCASIHSAPYWRLQNANVTCWWETTDTTVKLWPNPRTHGDPPAVLFQLDALARLALARAQNIYCETAVGQMELKL